MGKNDDISCSVLQKLESESMHILGELDGSGPVSCELTKKYLTRWHDDARGGSAKMVIEQVFIPAQRNMVRFNTGTVPGKSFAKMMLNTLNREPKKKGVVKQHPETAKLFFSEVLRIVRPPY